MIYFKQELATIAQRLKKTLERWVPVQDSMVHFTNPVSFDDTTQEFLRLSDLDFLVVIGTP